jgi:hypothetical protein
MVGSSWKPYIGQAVGGELDLMMLIGGVEEQAAIQLEVITTYFLPYIRLPKMPSHYVLTLKMGTAVFAEILDNSQHSVQLIPKS